MNRYLSLAASTMGQQCAKPAENEALEPAN
jgi:hypothetical protein